MSAPDWENGEPYIVESPSRVRLGPDAKFWARQYGLTNAQFAKHLLRQAALSPPNIGTDVLAPWTAAGEPNEYQAQPDEEYYQAQVEQGSPGELDVNVLGAKPW